MKTVSVAAAIISTAILSACSTKDVAGPDNNRYTIQPVNAVQRVLASAESVQADALPQVRVLCADSVPVSDVQVTFTRTGNGKPTGYVTRTDRSGIARLDVWPIGTASGEYTVTVSVSGAPSIAFTTFVRGATLATYEESEPVSAAGGRLYLFDDGSYIDGGINPPEVHTLPTGRYKVVDVASIQFTIEPQRGIFAVGWLIGNQMKFTHTQNYADFPDVVYTRKVGEIPPAINYKIQAVSSAQLVVTPGQNVDSQLLPGVRLLYPNNVPAAGVPVTFTKSSDGSWPAFSVVTDGVGIARLDAWQIGSEVGDYSVSVRVGGTQSLVFTAFVHGKIIEAYDLSEPIPSESLAAGGAHYVLFDDGTYAHYYGPAIANETILFPNGRFKSVDSATISFSGSFPNTAAAYSTGKFSSNTLRVTYFDMENEDETYARRN